MYVKKKFMLLTAVFALALPLIFAGSAGAVYQIDGAKTVSAGVYDNPNDGMCVIGVDASGNMLVDTSITNNRDCVAYTTNLTGLTTQAACAPTTGAVGTDGWRHQWTTSLCKDTVSGNGVSRVNLDNTNYMCLAKGGTLSQTGCIAYGWLYKGVKSDQTTTITTSASVVAPFNTSNYVTTKGRAAADNLGFCYTKINMVDVGSYITASYSTGVECPGYHMSKVAGTYNTLDWPAGADGNLYQTQAAFNAGYGWTFNTTANPQCNYAYGVKGIIPAAITGITTSFTAGSVVDASVYTTQGDCTAAGLTWENWTPSSSATLSSLTGTVGTAWQFMVFNTSATGTAGGGKFTTRQCLRCHSDMSRSYMERNKTSWTKTGHKLAGDATGKAYQNIGDAWGLKGVMCSMCHASSNPAQPDFIQTASTTTTSKKGTSTHDNDAYGAQVTQLCYYCHSGDGATTTPAATIKTAGSDLKINAKGLAPIANEFLNSPHAEYSGTDSGDQMQDKTKYTSTFVGLVCRSSNSVSSGSILSTYWDGASAQKIPNVNTATNLYCSNSGTNGSPLGANGYWVAEGNSLAVAQGNCSTCHDVHYSLDDTAAGAEPIRRECVTCHTDGNTNVPQVQAPVQWQTVKHPTTPGTPFDASKYADSCAVCHMSVQGAADGKTSQALHFFRINTDASYATMGATNVNLDSNGKAWVDIDLACGQCHGGSFGSGATANGAPYFAKAGLATAAVGMHGASTSVATTPPVAGTINAVVSNWTVSFTDASTDADGTVDTVVVNWGDGTTSTQTAGSMFTHTYSSAQQRSYTIILTVKDPVSTVASSSSATSVTVPQKFTLSGKVTAADTTTPIATAYVYLKQNGITKQSKSTASNGTFAFTNVVGGNYTITVTKTGKVFDVPAYSVSNLSADNTTLNLSAH